MRARIEDWSRLAEETDFLPTKMASARGITARHLRRIFHQEFDTPPSRWLRQVQCQCAVQLLRRGLPNKEVARRLKFTDAAHFCREFKKMFGPPPQRYI